jgi:hypothetical protein
MQKMYEIKNKSRIHYFFSSLSNQTESTTQIKKEEEIPETWSLHVLQGEMDRGVF